MEESMAPTVETTIRSIVVEDIRAAGVFDQLGIDYSCQGDRTLGEECRDRGLPAEQVIAALIAVAEAPGERVNFAAWEPQVLASYIVAEHHEYVRATLPTLIELSKTVAALHGDRHPEFHEVAVLVGSIAHDLTAHMLKEERILFPYIAELGSSGYPVSSPFGSVENPIRMMEREHELADRMTVRIRELVHDYAPPDDASITYRVCLEALREFDHDLRRHMHLENNVLFPKARRLEAGDE
jgi:regulator of cell morphogenesis and NO signaling